MDLKKIIYSMHPLVKNILPKIKNCDVLNETDIKASVNLAIEENLVENNKHETEIIVLDKFGEKFVNTELPENKVLIDILSEPKLKSELSIEDEEFSQAIGILKMNKLVEISKDEKTNEMKFTKTDLVEDFLKNNQNKLNLFVSGIEVEKLTEETKKYFEIYSKRKGFIKKTIKKTDNFKLTELGEKILNEIEKNFQDLELTENLTTEMLKSGEYKNKTFRHYNINLETPILDIGRRHPTIEANNIISDIFIEMGFKEMAGPMIESCFWNMDIMWIPQDHPARDEQDTFYLDGECEIDKELLEKVKQMHETGLNKTHTLPGEFSCDISKKRLLRTHSTATTFRTLYELGKKLKTGEDINGKYFYVANNFRNEAVDATHLAEFFQAEGFIIGDDLSLADLMGFIKEFCNKLGIEKIRFKPTFNPYTEPSMEAHYFDEKMNKWYALINSGIFRGETLSPIGLENKSIIAWGFGASRLATLLTGAKSMRDITGATCDFDWLKKRPIMTREIVKRN